MFPLTKRSRPVSCTYWYFLSLFTVSFCFLIFSSLYISLLPSLSPSLTSSCGLWSCVISGLVIVSSPHETWWYIWLYSSTMDAVCWQRSPLELICEMLFSVIGWCKAAGEGNFFSAQGCRFQLACFYAAEVFFQLNAGPELAKDLYFMKVKETAFPFYLWCDFFTRLGLQQPLY